ncbi:LysR family transcriptional regulator [Saxibacter everestensis]|uniref:LysR family transcriptional regulator n=1 Tax=Saxibacter everestensis TaxID=2909229 RepID=A0ABY8QUA0_9MICO|nr:LysR family transcriptional regulator [Brevibacteriaceae bacterium ZFBP1038]
MLDIHRLRVLRSVVGTGSIQAASKKLGFTPSAISQQITLLQRETGLTLVERVGRGIQPTASGIELAEAAAPVLEQMAELDALARRLRDGQTGTLSLAFFASAGTVLVPTTVARLQQEFPDLHVDLELIDVPLAVAESTARPDVQLIVTSAFGAPPPGFSQVPLHRDPYHVVVPAGHPLAKREGPLTLVDLADEPWVDNEYPTAACREVVMTACAQSGFHPRFSVQTRDYPTAVAFVGAGLGITVMPQLALSSVPSTVTVIPLVDPPVREIVALVKDRSRSSSAVNRTIELLHEAVRVAHPKAA